MSGSGKEGGRYELLTGGKEWWCGEMRGEAEDVPGYVPCCAGMGLTGLAQGGRGNLKGGACEGRNTLGVVNDAREVVRTGPTLCELVSCGEGALGGGAPQGVSAIVQQSAEPCMKQTSQTVPRRPAGITCGGDSVYSRPAARAGSYSHVQNPFEVSFVASSLQK